MFNNTSVLFFANSLNDHFFHTCITCALYKGIEKVTVLDQKDFNSDLISNINDTMLFLKQHLMVRYEFDGSPARYKFSGFVNVIFLKKTQEKTVEKILELLKENPAITNNDIQKATGLSRRGVEWQIKNLKDKGVLERIGPDKGGKWKVNEKTMQGF